MQTHDGRDDRLMLQGRQGAIAVQIALKLIRDFQEFCDCLVDRFHSFVLLAFGHTIDMLEPERASPLLGRTPAICSV